MSKRKAKILTLPDLIVLSLLSERPIHGYQLVMELEIREVQDWAAISRPQVYYSLNKLLKKRLISEARDSGESLGPERTTFKINQSGKDALATSLSTEKWSQQRERPAFLTWLALSSHLSKDVIRNLFEERRKYLRQELIREKATLESFNNADGAMVVAGRLMVKLTVSSFELELDWLSTAQIQMLERK